MVAGTHGDNGGAGSSVVSKEAAMVAADYRRVKGSDRLPWHFCANCKDWPKANFESSAQPERPVCQQCVSLQRRQMCTRAEAFV